MSYQRKCWQGNACQSFFWYDNEAHFIVTWLLSLLQNTACISPPHLMNSDWTLSGQLLTAFVKACYPRLLACSVQYVEHEFFTFSLLYLIVCVLQWCTIPIPESESIPEWFQFLLESESESEFQSNPDIFIFSIFHGFLLDLSIKDSIHFSLCVSLHQKKVYNWKTF